jgi:hypothetical protein
MPRTCVLAAALLSLSVAASAAEQGKSSSWTSEKKSSSWSSEKMRLKPPPRAVLPSDELAGNCPGLTVTIKTRIERLKALQEKATQEQWPPPSITGLWAKRPLGGDIARQRQQIAQLNAALGAKGCQTVDVDAELRRLPSAVTGAKPK